MYRIYELLQNIQYAANRYKDEVSEGYVETLALTATAFGEIFRIFHEDKKFAEAWLMHEIAQILIGNTSYRKKADSDCITILCDNNALHHSIKSWNSRYYSYRIHELKQILKSLTANSSLKNRFLVIMKMTGRDFTYKKRIDEAKAIAMKLKVPYTTMDALIKKDIELHKNDSTDQDKENKKWNRNDLLGEE